MGAWKEITGVGLCRKESGLSRLYAEGAGLPLQLSPTSATLRLAFSRFPQV